MSVRVGIVAGDGRVLRTLERIVSAGAPAMEVAGSTTSPRALDLTGRGRLQVAVVDLTGMEAPNQTLRALLDANVPVLVLVGKAGGLPASVAALALGAAETLPKPTRWGPHAEAHLRSRITALADRRRAPTQQSPAASGEGRDLAHPIVAIGASTGGPPAVATVLARLGGLRATVLVVQHIHDEFVAGFAAWMRRVSALPVEIARDGMALGKSSVVIAPGGSHLMLDDTGRLHLTTSPAHLHTPSADVLFGSIADSGAAPRSVGILLTGMGSDGAEGLASMRRAGAFTIAQNEATSAVYGMPKAAAKVGVDAVLSLPEIAPAVLRAINHGERGR